MTAMVRAAGLMGYPALMRSLGVDPLPLLRRYHIAAAQLQDEDALVSLRDGIELLEASAAAARCDDLGLRMAQVQGINTLGALAVAMQHSPTVADALQCASRHLYVHSAGMVFSVLPHSTLVAGAAELRFELVLPHPPVLRQVTDQSIGTLHRILQFLARDQYVLKAVSLPHRPLAPLTTYRAFFGAPVRVDQPYAGLHVDAQTLAVRLQAVNEPLRRMAMDYLAQQFGEPGQTLATRVRIAIRRTLGSNLARRPAIAELLNMHPRTLQRRLELEGTTFEALREEVCKQAALRYLRETQVPLSQVAGLLGLSEQSALTRSCRRWFDAPPSQLRTAYRHQAAKQRAAS